MRAAGPRPISAAMHEFCAAPFSAPLQELMMPFNPSAADSTYSYATTRVDPYTWASLQRRPEATAPCPACGSTRPRAGFCCDPCHKPFMEEQHRLWSRPGTARERPDWPRDPGARVRHEIGRPPQSIGGRPDPCWQTDEQVGAWSRCVRALEEAAA